MDEVSKIGKISKQWTGLLREAFTDADNFGIQFPIDLDVRMKAVMIGACFLIVSSKHFYVLSVSDEILLHIKGVIVNIQPLNVAFHLPIPLY